jgi:CheY-like chemotaxis protein
VAVLKTVLLIEKNAAVAARVRATLEAAGCRVRWTKSIDDLAVRTEGEVDLIISDVPGPPYGWVEDGLKSLSDIRQAATGAPVLLLTDWIGLGDARAKELGLAGAVRKPLVAEELTVAVSRQLCQPVPERTPLHLGQKTIDTVPNVEEASLEDEAWVA